MNNPTEFPPKDDTENKDTLQTLEEVETYTTPEIVDSHLAALRVRQLEEKDTDSLIKEKRSEINELIDKALEQKPKGDEAFQDHRLAEEKQQKRSWLGSTLAKVTAFGALLGLGMGQAKADTVKHDPMDSTSIDVSNARKVKEKPAGYKEFKKDDKTYFYKATSTTKGGLEMAKPSAEKGGQEYEAHIIQLIKDGASVDELVQKKYISKEKAAELRQYEKNSLLDVAYMEGSQQHKESNPFAAFAKDGEAIYAPNGHIAAEVFYPVRSSSDIKDGGMLNTQETHVLIRERNDAGFTHNYTIVSPEKFAELFGGSHSFQSGSKVEEIQTLYAATKAGGSDMVQK